MHIYDQSYERIAERIQWELQLQRDGGKRMQLDGLDNLYMAAHHFYW